MIIAVDTETRGLDTTKFLIGCIVTEKGKRYGFKNKHDMWRKILELGEKEAKYKKTLTVYAHNHKYDFLAYADYLNPYLKIYNNDRPFIIEYKNIRFLDTMNIYPMSLEKLGDMIGYEKLSMDERLKDTDYKWTESEIESLWEYCYRDCEIVIEAIKYIKKKLRDDKIPIKRLITSSQIAITNLNNKLSELVPEIYGYHKYKEIAWTKYKDEIHEAFRGGRVEAFKQGEHKHVYAIDKINLYGYIATKIRFPNPKSEFKINEPLNIFKQNELFNKIGISKVIIEVNNDKIGTLPVRQKVADTEENYYPNINGNIIVGTYTHDEIKYVLSKGYKLYYVEWSVIYDEMRSPLPEVFNELYDKRVKSNNEFDKYFYKQLMNRSLGKMAQKRAYQEFKFDVPEKYDVLISHGWEAIDDFDLYYLYRREIETKPKKYYFPILPTLVYANARVYMNEMMSKIPYKDLLYTDTDSIIMKNNHLNKYKIIKSIDGWKIDNEDVDCKIITKKVYMINDNVKFSGVSRNSRTKEAFESGAITDLQMVNIAKTKDKSMIGRFKEKKFNIDEIFEQANANKYVLQQRNIYIDIKTKLNNKIIKKLNKIIKNNNNESSN